jgi:hypothetical protein
MLSTIIYEGMLISEGGLEKLNAVKARRRQTVGS